IDDAQCGLRLDQRQQVVEGLFALPLELVVLLRIPGVDNHPSLQCVGVWAHEVGGEGPIGPTRLGPSLSTPWAHPSHTPPWAHRSYTPNGRRSGSVAASSVHRLCTLTPSRRTGRRPASVFSSSRTARADRSASSRVGGAVWLRVIVVKSP